MDDHDADQFLDATVYDVHGKKIGVVGDVYVDDDTGQPEWLLIDTGFFARGVHVPAHGLRRHRKGYRLPYTSDVVKSAPEVDVASAELSELDELDLYKHFGSSPNERRSELSSDVLLFVDRLFAGRAKPIGKDEVLDRAQEMGMPESVTGHLDTLPPGRLSREQVTLHLAEAQGTSIERAIVDGMGEAGRPAA